jgi:hypothetical protein
MTDRLRMDQPSAYHIVVQGHLDTTYADWLEGMLVVLTRDQQQQPVTILTGQLLDQAALIGVLRSLYNLRFPVLFVKWLQWNSDFVIENQIVQGEHSHEDD